MWCKVMGKIGLLSTLLLWVAACAPSARVGDRGSEPKERPGGTSAAPVGTSPVARPDSPGGVPGPTAAVPTPVPSFDPNNPDWPLRYQQLYEVYLARFEAPAIESDVEVLLEGGLGFRGILLEVGAEEVLILTAAGKRRVDLDVMHPVSQTLFFPERYAGLHARSRVRQEYEAWKSAQAGGGAGRSSTEVAVRPRNTEGVEVDPLHGPRRVRRTGAPPVNEEPTGRVRQVENYIRRHAAFPESLRVHEWGRVQPHGDGFTVRVRYSLEGAAGFGRSNEDMIFFMYADGTVYQRAAYRGN